MLTAETQGKRHWLLCILAAVHLVGMNWSIDEMGKEGKHSVYITQRTNCFNSGYVWVVFISLWVALVDPFIYFETIKKP